MSQVHLLPFFNILGQRDIELSLIYKHLEFLQKNLKGGKTWLNY